MHAHTVISGGIMASSTARRAHLALLLCIAVLLVLSEVECKKSKGKNSKGKAGKADSGSASSDVGLSAIEALEEGNVASAIKLAKKGLKADKNCATCLYALGVAHQQSREMNEMIQMFDKLIEVAPETPLAYKALTQLVQMTRQAGAKEQEAKYFSLIAAHHGESMTDEDREQYVVANHQANRFAENVAFLKPLQKSLHGFDQHRNFPVLLAVGLLKTGQAAKASAVMRKAAKTNVENINYAFNLYIANQIDEKDWVGAMQSFGIAIAKDRHSWNVLRKMRQMANTMQPHYRSLYPGKRAIIETAIAKVVKDSPNPVHGISMADDQGFYSIFATMSGVTSMHIHAHKKDTLRDFYIDATLKENKLDGSISIMKPLETFQDTPDEQVPSLVVINPIALPWMLKAVIPQLPAVNASLKRVHSEVTYIPRGFTVHALLEENIDKFHNQFAFETEGFSVAGFNRFSTSNLDDFRVKFGKPLSDDFEVYTLGFDNLMAPGAAPGERDFPVTITEDGVLHTLVYWLVSDFGDGVYLDEKKQLPQSIVFKDAVAVKKGQKLIVTFDVDMNGAYKFWIKSTEKKKKKKVNLHQSSPEQQILVWHFPMLNDDERNKIYHDGIKAVVKKGDHVLDIGVGSGLLTMMSLNAGAAHVTACDFVEHIAYTARDIMYEENNVSPTKAVVHAKMSSDLVIGKDIPQKADVLVQEIFGAELFDEGVIPSLIDAHKRLLKPNAKVIPHATNFFVNLVQSQEWAESSVFNVTGVKTSMLNTQRTDLEHNHDMNSYSDLIYLADHTKVFHIDLSSKHIKPTDTKHMKIKVKRTGRIDFIVMWFDMEFANGGYMNTGPEADEKFKRNNAQNSWKQGTRFVKPKWAKDPSARYHFKKGQVINLLVTYEDGRVEFDLE